jgi:hypothetical protein
MNCIISYQFFLGMMKMIIYRRMGSLKKRAKLFLYLKKLHTVISWRYSFELCIIKIKYYSAYIFFSKNAEELRFVILRRLKWGKETRYTTHLFSSYILARKKLRSGHYLRPAIYIYLVVLVLF